MELLSRLCSANLLLIGPDVIAREYLGPLMPSLASPVVGIDGARPDLPTEPVGTLIVWDVGRLTLLQQRQLLKWLSVEQASARIIAMSEHSLFARVQQGAFSDQLYYRLNTITIVLAPRRNLAAGSLDSPASQLAS